MRSICRLIAVFAIVRFIGIARQLHASEKAADAGAVSEHAAAAADEDHGSSHTLVHKMMFLAFQLGVILIAAKLVGEIFERALKMPAVLGELAAGLIIGPFALGGLVIPGLGEPLFPPGEAANAVVPVSEILYGVATFAGRPRPPSSASAAVGVACCSCWERAQTRWRRPAPPPAR